MPEEYFLLAHHDDSGKPRLARVVLATGLAGALLCDLLLAEHVTVVRTAQDAMLASWAAAPPPRPRRSVEPADPMVRAVLALLGRQGPTAAAALIAYVRDIVGIYPLIGDRLTRRGIVGATRRLIRRARCYPASEAVIAAGPRYRLRALASEYNLEGDRFPAGQQPDPPTVALAAVVLATGLASAIADAANRPARTGLQAIAAVPCADVPVVVTAVADAVTAMTLRTPRGQ